MDVRAPGQIHDDPDILARLGIACLLGRHWPAAAMAPFHADRTTSHCADCGCAMERRADGGWIALPTHRAPAPSPLAC